MSIRKPSMGLQRSVSGTDGKEIRQDLSFRAGDDTHGFTLPAFGINKDVPPLTVAHASFIAGKEGMFPFHCPFHRPWMAGELVVLPRRGPETWDAGC